MDEHGFDVFGGGAVEGQLVDGVDELGVGGFHPVEDVEQGKLGVGRLFEQLVEGFDTCLRLTVSDKGPGGEGADFVGLIF